MLGEESNIITFQNLFEIDTVDYEATWYMGWIFPGIEKVDERLPERTTLQRKMKKYLFGWEEVWNCQRTSKYMTVQPYTIPSHMLYLDCL